LEALWDSFYPLTGLDASRRHVIELLLKTMPAFVALLVNHRPRALRGRSLVEVLDTDQRQPSRLAHLFEMWGGSPVQMREAAPSLVFAVIGQANADGKISPEEESRLLTNLLTYWALRGTLDVSAYCSQSLRTNGRGHQSLMINATKENQQSITV
jgi:hypothetical protein